MRRLGVIAGFIMACSAVVISAAPAGADAAWELNANHVIVTGAGLLAVGLIGWFAGRSLQRNGWNPTRRPRPGEIWWAMVPFRETVGEKRRPCLVLRRDGQTFEALKITSQDKSERRDHVEIPTSSWDHKADHNSFLDLSTPFQLRRANLHKRAGYIDAATWQRVIRAHPVGDVPATAGTVSGSVRLLTGRAMAVLSRITVAAGLLTIGAGVTVVPWLDGARQDSATAATADRPLHDITVVARDVGSSGRKTDSTIDGRHFPDSTGFWVGCEGRAATATYQLNGVWRRLTATAGLDATAPAGLVARLTVEADGKKVLSGSVSRRKSLIIDLDLTSVRMLTVSAERVEGACGTSARPYGALGSAIVRH